MNIIIDEMELMEAELLAERAKVITNVLSEGYFGTNESPETWKIAGDYYKNARILLETVHSLIQDCNEIIIKIIDAAPICKD